MTDPYTTQLQAGLGIVPETHVLLDIWHTGMTPQGLYEMALEAGTFSNLSARRLKNLVLECFAPRYLVDDGRPAQLIQAARKTLSARKIDQLLFVYTCRANAILHDFVRQVYWPAYATGKDRVSNIEARAWVDLANAEGRTSKRWSEKTIDKVTAYITRCCADFGLLEQGSRRERRILSYRLLTEPAIILAYELHFSGLGDNQVVGHPDWGLFGLERQDVIEEFKRVALPGGLVVQSAAGATKISWQYSTMQEVVDVLA